MPKLNLTASAYRVARRKGEIAREAKWQKTAKLTSKKSLESRTPKPEEKVSEGRNDPNRPTAPEAEDPGSPLQGKTAEIIGPKAPDQKKGRQKT
jgi:hypothetical protein